MSEFTINCTGDVVTGDHIRFSEGVFSGSYRKPKYQGERIIEALVVRDSYGEAKQQHTFTLEVTASKGKDALPVGKTICRKGRNVYRNGTQRKPWADETQRGEALEEKHQRGDNARAARQHRLWLRDMFAADYHGLI